MAELFLGSVVEASLSRVVSGITEEIKLAWDLDEQLNLLRDSLSMVRHLLKDADEQQKTQMAVRRWLIKLKGWAYDAEDVLDELVYELLRQKVEADAKLQNFCKFSTGIHFVHKAASRVKMANRVKNLNELLDRIKNEALGFGLKVISADKRSQISWERVTDSIIDHPVVARDDEVSEIVNLLDVSRCGQSLTVVAIVGMGGLGKTAVAKLVCEEVMARKLFDVKMWVRVPPKFDDQKILGEMLQTLDKTAGGITNKDATIQHLQQLLERKSFLLVLDDVWNCGWWDTLKSRLSLISKNNGSAVVVTTRSEEVASLMETSSQCRHKLKFLSLDECWSIIVERLSSNNGASLPSDLVAIGKEIAAKCGGLPLAARVLGGTMQRNITKEAWLTIKDSEILNVSEGEVSIESILKLSFDRLPSHLKPCFAYCSMWPKRYPIEKEGIITLWMAQGLLESPMEDTGEKYFNQLLMSSFLQDAERDQFENIKSARMHDLVHDLALSISRFDTWTCHAAEKVGLYSVGNDLIHLKHLSTIDWRPVSTSVLPPFLICEAKKLRSLWTTNAQNFRNSWKFKSLRTLILACSDLKELPPSIGKLQHLRFLDVSYSEITVFPESLTKLYNLQKLWLIECKLLEKLPKTLRNLVSLRDIRFSYKKHMPSEVGCLVHLRALPFFFVGCGRGHTIQELECLNELSGKLEICNLEEVRNEDEAKKATLQSKGKIKELRLIWTASERESSSCNDEKVLENLQPFEGLKALVVENYLGEKLPSWLLTMKITRYNGDCWTLNNLMQLKLKGFRRCEEIPRLGCLPHLRDLELVGLDNVRYLNAQFYGSIREITSSALFPALKRFCLGEMNSLVEWMAPKPFRVFPCLEDLHIFECPKLRSIPTSHLFSLVQFRIRSCDEFNELLLDEGHPFTSLNLLKIEGCSNLEAIGSVHGLTSLSDLEIGRCNKLTSLPGGLRFCSSLKSFQIWSCYGLTSVPEDLRELSSLNYLSINDCPKVSNFTGDILHSLSQLTQLGISCYYECLNSIQDLHSLAWLAIDGLNFKSLPDQLQNLTTLKSLYIYHFQVEALPEWLGNMSSLQFLGILSCENLKHLPSATTLQSLFQLRELKIENCRLLKERCAKGSGSEWSKISHIPHIIMDEETLQGFEENAA